MQTETTSRRSFYLACINGLGALITAALAIPAAAYLLIKPASKKASQWVNVADLSQLQLRKPEEVTFQRHRVDGWRTVNEKSTAWIVRLDEQNVVAFSPSCTHLGCAYHWDNQSNNFICPCHTSVFSMDGKVLAGPAPRPLDRFLTRVDGAKLQISPTIQKS